MTFFLRLFLWPDANQAAQTITPPSGYQAGHLLTISNLAEQQFVYGAWPIDEGWFGFTDAAVEGEWRWIDSTPGIWQDPDDFVVPIQTAFTNWSIDEPNDSYVTREDYGVFNNGSGHLGRWNDGVGTSGLPFGYFVEFEPVAIPVPSSMIALLATLSLLRIGFHRRAIGVGSF